MTKCPRCANTKENYIQEGQNRCKVCFICWPIEEPATPKDKPTVGQLIGYGFSPSVMPGPLLSGDIKVEGNKLKPGEGKWSVTMPWQTCLCPACKRPLPSKEEEEAINAELRAIKMQLEWLKKVPGPNGLSLRMAGMDWAGEKK